MKFHTYILKSQTTGQYYIGSTGDIEKRIADHNSGKVKSTRAKRPWSLVYSEEFQSRAEAFKREAAIKAKKKRIYIEKLIDGEIW